MLWTVGPSDFFFTDRIRQQRETTVADAAGFPTATYADVTGYTAIPCNIQFYRTRREIQTEQQRFVADGAVYFQRPFDWLPMDRFYYERRGKYFVLVGGFNPGEQDAYYVAYLQEIN